METLDRNSDTYRRMSRGQRRAYWTGYGIALVVGLLAIAGMAWCIFQLAQVVMP